MRKNHDREARADVGIAFTVRGLRHGATRSCLYRRRPAQRCSRLPCSGQSKLPCVREQRVCGQSTSALAAPKAEEVVIVRACGPRTRGLFDAHGERFVNPTIT